MKTLLLLASLFCAPPSPDFTQSVLALSGAYTLEELSESELERFEALERHPLRINCLSARSLVASGLFSAYQAASICDYRSRSGDILSLAEFALLDGIGPDLAVTLAPFIDFQASGGEAHRPVIVGSARAGVAWKKAPGYEASLKADLQLHRFELFGTYRRKSGKSGFSLGGGYENARLRLYLGDYRLRLGQGLVAWSGFSMAGVSGPSSLNRNPTFLGLSHSYSSYLRGAAASYSFGRTEIGASWTIPAVARDPGSGVLYLSHLSDRGQWAAKAYLDRNGLVAGIDGKLQFGECCFFSEAAYSYRVGKGSPAVVVGVDWTPAYGKRLAAALRYYGPDYEAPLSGGLRSSTKTTDELGASCSLTLPDLGISADISRALRARKAVGKLSASYSPTLSLPFGLELKPSLKSSFSYRPYNLYKSKIGLRADLEIVREALSAHFRFEAVRCRELSWLWYLELGYEGEVKAFARFTLFRIDNWDDRIYVYERDAPGNFSSTAYYGRGLGASLYLKYRSAYLVFSLLRHPWSDRSKSETGLSLQYEF